MSYSFTVPQARVIEMQKPEGNITPDLAAINLAAPVKAARAADNLGFALTTLEREGCLTSDQVPEGCSVTMGEAFATIRAGLMGITQFRGHIPAGMDKAAVKAFDELVAKAASNGKSPLQQHCAGVLNVTR